MTTMDEIAKGLPSALKGARKAKGALVPKTWADHKLAAHEHGKAKAFYENQLQTVPRHLRASSSIRESGATHYNRGQTAARKGRRMMGIKQFELNT